MNKPNYRGDVGTQRSRGIYHGWIITAVSFLSISGSIGFTQYAFGLFIVPLEKEFGWIRTEINVAIMLGVIIHLFSPAVGKILDIFGSRYVMSVSLTVITTVFLLRSIMTGLWQFYLFSSLIFAGSPGAAMLPTERLVTLWFPSIRGCIRVL